jgi:ribonuclease P/MRP protein subunit RPP40
MYLDYNLLIMFNFSAGKKEQSTCYVTHGTMGHVDPKQPPTKRKPFAPLLTIPFAHKVRAERQKF